MAKIFLVCPRCKRVWPVTEDQQRTANRSLGGGILCSDCSADDYGRSLIAEAERQQQFLRKYREAG